MLNREQNAMENTETSLEKGTYWSVKDREPNELFLRQNLDVEEIELEGWG
jgi:hypothetical protein